MNKELLISIKPKHLVNILNGEKTLELRKTVPKDYKGWVNIYCTKSKPYLGKNHDGNIGLYNIPAFGHFNKSGDLNGKVVARFWFDEYTELTWIDGYNFSDGFGRYNTIDIVIKNTCLTENEIDNYGKSKKLYAWHIKKLEIFDTPKKLSEFQNYVGKVDDTPEWAITSSWQIFHRPLEKAPQSYQFVYTKELEKEEENEKNMRSVWKRNDYA